MKLLVKSCFFGFGFLTIFSYLLTEHINLYLGNFICMITGMLCHYENNYQYCLIDKISVFFIGIINLVDYFLHNEYFFLNIVLLINIVIVISNYIINHNFDSIHHFKYIHLHSFSVILFLIVNKYYLLKDA